MSLVVAVDVGGTAIKGMALDHTGAVVAEVERPTPRGAGPEAVVAAVTAVARELSPGAVAAAVIVPGVVDREAGVASYSANLGWRDVPLRAVLQDALGIPVAVDHDVRTAAEAELVLGAARGVDDCLVVVIGTGIAAVTIAGGRIVRGATGRAGELGHMPVRPGGEPCACGQLGCLETYASAGSIARRYRARAGQALTTPQVIAAVAHDADAAVVFADAVGTLATALVTAVMYEDPALVVVAGGLSEAGDTLLAPVRAAVATGVVWRDVPPIVASTLSARAGRYGAAVLAHRLAGHDDFSRWPLRTRTVIL